MFDQHGDEIVKEENLEPVQFKDIRKSTQKLLPETNQRDQASNAEARTPKKLPNGLYEYAFPSIVAHLVLIMLIDVTTLARTNKPVDIFGIYYLLTALSVLMFPQLPRGAPSSSKIQDWSRR